MKTISRNATRCTIAAVTLLLVALTLSGSRKRERVEDHPLLEAIERVFERSQTDDLKEYGLDNSLSSPGVYNHSIKGCWLKKGEAKINSPTLEPGVEYAVIAAGDKHATKVKIKILNVVGQIRSATDSDPVLTESTEDNATPGAVFKLTKKQSVGIRISLEDVDPDSGKDSAYVAFLLLRKDAGWDVPLANIKQVAQRLQKRIDKVREANAGSADLAYSWFSIHGGVIPGGASSSNGHNFKAGGKYIVVAASDDNAETLEVSADGNVRAPKDEEILDDEPKVTYKNTPKSQFTGQHKVKNNGKTSIVLVGIVQLIEGG